MRRRRHLVELVVIFCLVAGAAAWHYRQNRPDEDYSYQQLRLKLQKEWSAGNLTNCMGACYELLAKDPADLLALRYLGLIALRQNQPHRARDFFNRGLAATVPVESTIWSEFYGLTGAGRGCLLRERARLAVSERRWADALRDAAEAKRILRWGADCDLAQDVWCCAQYGAGNVTQARAEYPQVPPWDDGPIHALLLQHAERLNVSQEAVSRQKPIWHPRPCPLCP